MKRILIAGRRRVPPPTRGAARRGVIGWLRLPGLVLLFAAVLAAVSGRIDVAAVHKQAERLNGGVAFALLVVLPLAGFPVSVLHVAAGVRFGAALGWPLVALSIGLQLAASYALVHARRDWFARRFARVRRNIPTGAHASIAVMAVLLPGAPYAAINYVLPVLGLRLRTILAYCWPLHTLRSSVTVFVGDQSDELTPVRLGALAAYALLLAAASWLTYRRLRRRLGDPPAAEDGRTRPA